MLTLAESDVDLAEARTLAEYRASAIVKAEQTMNELLDRIHELEAAIDGVVAWATDCGAAEAEAVMRLKSVRDEWGVAKRRREGLAEL